MSTVRNLATDLVEKKLWPVAAALVVATAAVLLLLGGGGSTPSPAPKLGASAPAEGTPASVRVTLDDSATTGTKNRPGAVRNPFRQQHQPKDETASAAAAATATTSTATSGGGGTSSATGAGASSPKSTTVTPGNDSFDAKTGLVKHTETPATTVTKTTTAVAKTGYAYRVAWRFGPDGGALKSNHDAARLTALPSAKNPVLQFFGVLEDWRTATFLVRSGATVEGEGWCHPSPADCRTLDLRPGDVAAMSYDGHRYRIGVSKIERGKVSAAAARAGHKRVAASGVAVLAEAVKAKAPALEELAFDTASGLLKPKAG
jgi:hypothetical protein